MHKLRGKELIPLKVNTTFVLIPIHFVVHLFLGLRWLLVDIKNIKWYLNECFYKTTSSY